MPHIARPEPFDSPLILSLSKDERLAQDVLVEGRARGSTGSPRAWLVVSALCLLAISFVSAQTDKTDALSDAARKGDAAAVKKLLDEGVNVNTRFRYDRTALSFAADRGHVEVVKVLLARGADVALKDTFYNATALTWAVNPAQDRKPEHTEVVRLLLEHGGYSADALSAALQAATRAKLDDVVALLEKAGAKAKER